MFAWNCAEAGGTHLGTCVDRFYFGSCCQMPDVLSSEELEVKPVDQSLEPNSPDENLAAPAVTTIKTTTTTTTTTSTTTTTQKTTTTTTTAPSTTTQKGTIFKVYFSFSLHFHSLILQRQR